VVSSGGAGPCGRAEGSVFGWRLLEQVSCGQGEDGEHDHDSGGDHASGFGEADGEHDQEGRHEPIGCQGRQQPDRAEGERGGEADRGIKGDFAAGFEVAHYAAENQENDVNPEDCGGIHAVGLLM
jgi:hypothetical protein